ncbi:2-polyprenyl-6-methoxyphenol hydroxylase-like FAD-dependent oxidoreductase [Pseudonocardia hierapolitana]|uniref:2-polyprenyl-6-methoxyphenol hydroxylase-like FAD-dependent oxidoreductase n=1 Tax=Pseudonocardia hierapolitana TaxID=1128676 RepID=A0A561SIA1_9PSEU|nr:2-polyprenyl-6-methoxyphenol hydroxylase-like FAD-dependent oxidoreductase [Pseudonocardia hierapolitana]
MLVVGGGLVGLTAALVLRHHGVSVTLVERRETTSPQPKARRFHFRSMEVFRELGLAATVHEAARDLADHDRMAVGHTLAEAEQLPLWQPGDVDVLEVSPELPCLVAQDALEPVLRAAAQDAGADVRFATALTGFEQDADGVADPGGRWLRASYLVAADGARSGVRTALGIGRSGRGAVGEPAVNVYFRADLEDVVRGREFNLCQIEHPDAPGALASVDGRFRWVFMTSGERTDRDWPALLRTALGVPAPDLDVLSVLPWQPEMLVADRYSAGRVHLVGDAAHVMPPFAAMGANTGISDAHELGWKLAAALSGDAPPALLDSYDAERRPAGWFAADQSARRTLDLRGTGTPDPDLAHPFLLVAGGFQYTDGALCRADGQDPEPVHEFAPAGRVGTRVPHRWLDEARTRSTLDLAGPGWALLVAGDPRPWERDAGGVAVHRLDADFLPAGTALLLRPDDVVAWRGTDVTAPPRVLRDLLGPTAVAA